MRRSRLLVVGVISLLVLGLGGILRGDIIFDDDLEGEELGSGWMSALYTSEGFVWGGSVTVADSRMTISVPVGEEQYLLAPIAWPGMRISFYGCRFESWGDAMFGLGLGVQAYPYWNMFAATSGEAGSGVGWSATDQEGYHMGPWVDGHYEIEWGLDGMTTIYQNGSLVHQATYDSPKDPRYNYGITGIGVREGSFSVDRVTITSIVPEPGTFTLMMCGLVALKRQKGNRAKPRRPLP